MLQSRMSVRLPKRQVCNFSAWVYPNNGTIETAHIVLLQLVLVSAHHLTRAHATYPLCSSVVARVADWEGLSGPAGCTGGPEGQI